MSGILLFFHVGSNTGYAIQRHEHTFSQMAHSLGFNYQDMHFGYPSLANGKSITLPEEVTNLIELDTFSEDKNHINEIKRYIREHDIRIAFGFDQPVKKQFFRHFRDAGIEYIFSYWGAPMSQVNRGLQLLIKRLDVMTHLNRPDMFIFQSEGMRKTATHGRGIPYRNTAVVNSGIDTEKFSPMVERDWYAYDEFNIPRQKKIIYYSGHMEERKGVHIIVKAAAYISNVLNRDDMHFLIFGNKNGEEKRFDKLYKGTKAEANITFGGYRNDLSKVLPCCYAGNIATTGWDSFTMSAVEIASCGLPLIVSDIPGLSEAVEHGETGFVFPVGQYEKLAEILIRLCDDETLRNTMGHAARRRVLLGFTQQHQIEGLANVVSMVVGDQR